MVSILPAHPRSAQRLMKGFEKCDAHRICAMHSLSRIWWSMAGRGSLTPRKPERPN